MIKFETNNRKSTIEMKGNTETLFNEMISFVRAFYEGIKEENEELAGFFEWFIRERLGHVIFDECEKDDESKEDNKKKEGSGDIDDDIKELIENLEELVKLLEK